MLWWNPSLMFFKWVTFVSSNLLNWCVNIKPLCCYTILINFIKIHNRKKIVWKYNSIAYTQIKHFLSCDFEGLPVNHIIVYSLEKCTQTLSKKGAGCSIFQGGLRCSFYIGNNWQKVVIIWYMNTGPRTKIPHCDSPKCLTSGGIDWLVQTHTWDAKASSSPWEFSHPIRKCLPEDKM